MYPHNGRVSSLVWSSLVWPGLVGPGLAWSGVEWPECWCKHHSSDWASLFIGMKIYQKCIMHLYLLYVNTKIMCLTFDPAQTTMWPHVVATSLGLIMKLRSGTALALALAALSVPRPGQARLACLSIVFAPITVGNKGGTVGRWVGEGILHSNTNQTVPQSILDTRYSPLKCSFIMLLKFNK